MYIYIYMYVYIYIHIYIYIIYTHICISLYVHTGHYLLRILSRLSCVRSQRKRRRAKPWSRFEQFAS